MPNTLRKNLIILIISPLVVLPVLAFCYLYSGIEKYISISALISHVGVGVSIGIGSLFYFYPIMLIYGLPLTLILQHLNLFTLPIVLIVSIFPIFLLNLISEFNREILVLYLLALSIGLASWFTCNKAR